MKTNVSETSVNCYHGHIAPLKEMSQCDLVEAEIGRQKVCTRRMVAKSLGIETSTISARVNKLIAENRVIEDGASPCPITGKKVHWLKLAEKQFSIFDA
jgi:predicted transcriptional regulator